MEEEKREKYKYKDPEISGKFEFDIDSMKHLFRLYSSAMAEVLATEIDADIINRLRSTFYDLEIEIEDELNDIDYGVPDTGLYKFRYTGKGHEAKACIRDP